ncbi:MAG: tagaturonate reductase [Firmicutes bacterium]|nr:tagaturonate reductase [Bacillota bacterium]
MGDLKKLNRELLNSDFKFNDDLEIGTKKVLPEKIIQFGEGNFLRAFVDYMFNKINADGLFEGGITLIQPIPGGDFLRNVLNEQEGLYTLIARGREDGQKVVKKTLVTAVNRCINPYVDLNEYNACAKNPELRYVVSNTTEAGITWKDEEYVTDKPQDSFPAKVTNFLYERFKAFNGDKTKGLIFLPVELIDDNGKTLKKFVLQHAEKWDLGKDFIAWIEEANIFTSTLVDRIVTGYPRNEAQELCQQFGYEDNAIDTSEIFHTWVIEGPASLAEELPFPKAGLKVIYTDDVKPYKKRKVRILNGTHTCSVLAAYLSGFDIVRDMMNNDRFYNYLDKALNEEIIPAIESPELTYEDLKGFADAVFDRYKNPFIDHKLLDISLNSTSKFEARVLHTIQEYYDAKKALPSILTFSFAAYLAFYRGTEIKDGALVGYRNVNGAKEEYPVKDSPEVLDFYAKLWTGVDATDKAQIDKVVNTVASNTDFWLGSDLTKTLPGFAEKVSEHLFNILNNDVTSEIDKLL